jgi:hypothetical protein
MSIEDEEDSQDQYFSREEALAIARTEALRALEIRDDEITCVVFDPVFRDYCLCRFVREKDGWVKTLRSLTGEERIAGEQILDATILELTRAGNLVSAIRLYRTKHGVGLREAKLAVGSLR